MKKTREIEEYFCDYCGQKCEHTDFVVPEIEQITVPFNITTRPYATHKDICPKRQEKIAMLLKLVPNTDIEDGIFEINWRINQ